MRGKYIVDQSEAVRTTRAVRILLLCYLHLEVFLKLDFT